MLPGRRCEPADALHQMNVYPGTDDDSVPLSQAAMPPGGDVSELTWSADAYGAHTLGAFAELQACVKDEHTTLLLVRSLSAVSLFRRRGHTGFTRHWIIQVLAW